MALTKEEKEALEELERKRDAPDDPEEKGGGNGRVLNISLDLGDDAQLEKAFRLGFLERPTADDDADDDADDADEEEAPRRSGFFGDQK